MADSQLEPTHESPIPSLPPNKRYITTHSTDGTSIVHSSPAQHYNPVPGQSFYARSYSTASVPAILEGDEDVQAYLSETGATSYKDLSVASTCGSNLLVLDIQPGGASILHRTVSIDYTICVIGHVRIELDSGNMIDLYPGDHVVQRGTMHRTHNGSQTQPARLVAVTLPAVPFPIPGTGKMVAQEFLMDGDVEMTKAGQ